MRFVAITICAAIFTTGATVSAAVHFTTNRQALLSAVQGDVVEEDLERFTESLPLTGRPVELQGFILTHEGAKDRPEYNWITAPPHEIYVESPFAEGTLISAMVDSPSVGYEGMHYRIRFAQDVVAFGFRAVIERGGVDYEQVWIDVLREGAVIGRAMPVVVFGNRSLYGDFFGLYLSGENADEVIIRSATVSGGAHPQYGVPLELDEFVAVAVPEPSLSMSILSLAALLSRKPRAWTQTRR